MMSLCCPSNHQTGGKGQLPLLLGIGSSSVLLSHHLKIPCFFLRILYLFVTVLFLLNPCAVNYCCLNSLASFCSLTFLIWVSLIYILHSSFSQLSISSELPSYAASKRNLTEIQLNLWEELHHRFLKSL